MRVTRAVPPLVDRFSGFARQIEDTLAGRRYEIGIIEHFWCAPYQEQIAKVCGRTVLDLHNIESHLHQRCAEVEGNATAFAHRVFRRASLELERAWLPRFSAVAGRFGQRRGDGARHRPRRPHHGLPECHSVSRPSRRGAMRRQ